MTTYPLKMVPGLQRTSAEFRRLFVHCALSAGYEPNYVAAVISVESGFRANVQNMHGAPALGLIQFWRAYFPAVAKRAGMAVSWNDLRDLTATEQLPLVMAYLDGTGLKLLERPTPTDYYMAVFMPSFIGKDPSFVLGEKDSTERHDGGLLLSKVYDLNGGLDADGDGQITVADVGAKVEDALARATSTDHIEVNEGMLRAGCYPLLGGDISPSGLSQLLPPAPPSSLPESAKTEPPDAAADEEPSERAGDITLPSGHHSPLPTLRGGSIGMGVLLAQAAVGVSTDGMFGPATAAGVKALQRRYGLAPDGIVGPRTWGAIIEGVAQQRRLLGRPLGSPPAAGGSP